MQTTPLTSYTGDKNIDGLLGSRKWSSSTLSYSFGLSSDDYEPDYYYGEPFNNFAPLTPMQQAALNGGSVLRYNGTDWVSTYMGPGILAMVSSVSGLSFQQYTGNPGDPQDGPDRKDATLRFGKSDEPSTAWAYFPEEYPEAGDVWFNNSSGWYDSPLKGNYAYTTIIHELGHALGLKHPHESGGGGVMPTAYDSMEYTVMSYRAYEGASTRTGYTNENWGFAQSLMMYDIAALQHMYGARFTANDASDSTTYSWSPTTGEQFINGAGQGAPGAGASGANRIFMTVWDSGGTADVYDFSNYTTNLRVDLRPGHWTITSDLQRANLGNGQDADGNIANALLYDADGTGVGKPDLRSLIENAIGGSGADCIIGNDGNNELRGGKGHDRLVGMAGNDKLYGGVDAGETDTAVFSASLASYDVSFSNGVITVARGADDTDTVVGVELFQFGDWVYSAEEIVSACDGGEAELSIAMDRTLSGTSKNNTLTGDGSDEVLRGYAGADTLKGLGGHDQLIGGAGADILTGGTADLLTKGTAASDTFVYERVSDSTSRSRDTITDFEAGDHIDLRLIDASTQQAGDQAFAYIGSAGFSGYAGQLRFSGGILSGDTNGDMKADFEVAVRFATGVPTAVTTLQVYDLFL